MLKKNKFYKKVSNTERFYQVCEKISPPFSLQMLIEGSGDISIEELREAVKGVAKVNKGTIISLKRKGLNQYWFEGSFLPSVKIADEKYFEQFDDVEIVEFKEAGHYPMIESPVLFASKIESWIH